MIPFWTTFTSKTQNVFNHNFFEWLSIFVLVIQFWWKDVWVLDKRWDDSIEQYSNNAKLLIDGYSKAKLPVSCRNKSKYWNVNIAFSYIGVWKSVNKKNSFTEIYSEIEIDFILK